MDADMKSYRETFRKHLEGLDKESAHAYALSLLSEGRVTVPQLYEGVLTPVLNGIEVGRKEEDTMIWREHTMTGIARTIVECAYPFVLRTAREAFPGGIGRKAMVLCPEEEYHELGARMGADYFRLLGYEVFFIGGNTPKDSFLSAFDTLRPDVVAISVSNYLNLVPLKGIIATLREKAGAGTRIVLSGGAFQHAGKRAEDFGADLLVETFHDMDLMKEGGR